jgi:hypothetical protein
MKHERFENRSGVTALSSHRTPSKVLRDPHLSLEEKRELLASWSSDHFAVPSKPWLREIPGGGILNVADILAALRALDDDDPPPSGGMAARAEAIGAVKVSSKEITNQLIAAHQRNIDRYCRLLATHLTDVEREYIHKRIAETSRELDNFLRAACRSAVVLRSGDGDEQYILPVSDGGLRSRATAHDGRGVRPSEASVS